MEGISVLKDMVREGDFFTKIDIKDAYLTVPIHPEDRKFLHFRWKDALYDFSCLCFGLASAPWTFTKLVKPIVGFLRGKGIRLIVYPDDFLILNQSKERAERDYIVVSELLQEWGFLINEEKFIGDASQVRKFLGLIVDSVNLSLSLRQDKVRQIIELCRAASTRTFSQLRDIAKILGSLAWAVQAIPFAQSHFRCNRRFYIERSPASSMDLTVKFQLDDSSIQDFVGAEY